MSPNNLFNEDFKDFIQSLNQNEVEYLLVGGYSVNLHGYERSTGDMDIWVNPTSTNFDSLMKAFASFGMPTNAFSKDEFIDNEDVDVFTFGVPPVCIEILTRVKGLKFQPAFQGCVYYKIEEAISVRTLNLEDLIKAKKAAARHRDLDDLEHLKGD